MKGSLAGCRELIRHLRLRGLLGAYADHELAAPDRLRVAAHLARCWTCSGELQTLLLVKSSLRTTPKRAPMPLSAVRLRHFADRLAGGTGR